MARSDRSSHRRRGRSVSVAHRLALAIVAGWVSLGSPAQAQEPPPTTVRPARVAEPHHTWAAALNRLRRLLHLGRKPSTTRPVRHAAQPDPEPARGDAVGEPGPQLVERAAPVAPHDDPPTRQSVAVAAASLELACMAPEEVSASGSYVQRVIVRNTSDVAVNDIEVDVRFSSPVEIHRADPNVEKSDHERAVLWRVGELLPGQQRILRLHVRPLAAGTLRCRAVLRTATQTETLTTVRLVRLAARVDGPETITRGKQVELKLHVRNTGNAPAQNIVVRPARRGVQIASREPVPRFERRLAELGPGQEAVVSLPIVVLRSGTVRLPLEIVSADGARTEVVYVAEVRAPQLRIAIAPHRWLPGRSGTLQLSVANVGSARSETAQLLLYVAPTVKVEDVPAGATYREELRTVTLRVGPLEPGDSQEFRLNLAPTEAGEHRLRLCVITDDGIVRKLDYRLVALGVAAVNIEIHELSDPAVAGDELVYEMVVSNSGSADAREVELMCRWNGAFRCTGTEGPTPGQEREKGVVFAVLPRLRVGEVARYRVRGVAGVGAAITFEAVARSAKALPARDVETTTVLGR